MATGPSNAIPAGNLLLEEDLRASSREALYFSGLALNTDQFAVCIYNRKTNRVLVQDIFTANSWKSFAAHFPMPLSGVWIQQTGWCIVLPPQAEEFSGQTDELAFQLTTGQTATNLSAQTIVAANFRVVFNAHLDTQMQGCRHAVPALRLAHATGVWLEWAARQQGNGERKMALYYLGDSISIGLFEGIKLLFFNQFTAKSPEDVLYYSLSVLQNASWIPHEINYTCHFSGNTNQALLALLNEYLAPNEESQAFQNNHLLLHNAWLCG